MVGNEHRITECESNHVIWNKRNQFWQPTFGIVDSLELVSYHMSSKKLCYCRYIFYFVIRDFIWKTQENLDPRDRDFLTMTFPPVNLN